MVALVVVVLCVYCPKPRLTGFVLALAWETLLRSLSEGVGLAVARGIFAVGSIFKIWLPLAFEFMFMGWLAFAA